MITIVELVNPQAAILREIADSSATRNDVARTYASCIRRREEVDFAAVNRAIVDRWSLHALKYVKAKAWRIAEGRR